MADGVIDNQKLKNRKKVRRFIHILLLCIIIWGSVSEM